MLKKQIERVRGKIKEQANAVFGKERRKDRAKRDFLNEVYSTYRENEMTIVTHTLAKLRSLWKSCGKEAVWDIIKCEDDSHPPE